MSITTNLGKVCIVPRGVWSANTDYTRLDVVSYQGSGWMAKRQSTGVSPCEGEDWMMLASVGAGDMNKSVYDPDGNNAELATKASVDSKVSRTELAFVDKRFKWVSERMNGQSYTVEDGATPAYSHAVQSGAKAAAVNSVGGRTLVWNQITPITRAGGSYRGFTYINNGDGSWSISGTVTQEGQSSRILFSGSFSEGHKYYVRGVPDGASDSTYYIVFNGEHISHDRIVSYSQGSSYSVAISYEAEVGSGFSFTCSPQLYDLTRMFGAGKEPTAEVFEAMLTADYYAYNAGELLSAEVTAVTSKTAENAALDSLSIPAALRTAYPLLSTPGVQDEYDISNRVFIRRVGTRAYQSGDEDVSSYFTDGTNTYYPLAASVTADISQYIGEDNLLSVASGGTLTFTQSNTVSTRLPVPNDTEYAIALTEAI